MSKSKKEYHQEKKQILKSKISETEKSNKLFQNWQDYIFGSIPEETKRQNLAAYQSEMIFVRL